MILKVDKMAARWLWHQAFESDLMTLIIEKSLCEIFDTINISVRFCWSKHNNYVISFEKSLELLIILANIKKLE